MVETQELIFGNSWSGDKFQEEDADHQDKGSTHDGCQHRLFEQNEVIW